MNSDPNHPVIAFGEILFDNLPGGVSVLGGAPGNFAFRLQSLGVPVRIVSRLGRDALGAQATQQLVQAGLSAEFLQYDSQFPTGTVDVTLHCGNPSFVINRDVAYDQISLEDGLRRLASGTPLIYFGTLIQRSRLSRQSLYALLDSAPKAIHFLDINLRRECYDLDTVRESLQRAQVLKLNIEESKELARMLAIRSQDLSSFCQCLFSLFPIHTCVVTRGAAGAFACTRNGEEIDLPGYQVTVADTIGAGDAFSAGFAAGLLTGQSLKDCCEQGNILGALTATTTGGMTPINMARLEKWKALQQSAR